MDDIGIILRKEDREEAIKREKRLFVDTTRQSGSSLTAFKQFVEHVSRGSTVPIRMNDKALGYYYLALMNLNNEDGDLITESDKSNEMYLSDADLRKRIRYAKNPLERKLYEKELAERNRFSRKNRATKKKRNKRR